MAAVGKLEARIVAGLVWSVRVDAGSGTMALQVRNGEQRRATYFWLDMEDGTLGPGIDLEDGWWTELIAVRGHHLLIGKYGDAAMPVISERMVVDGKRAQLVATSEIPFGEEPQAELPFAMETLDAPPALPLLHDTYYLVLPKGQTQIVAWHTPLPDGPALYLEIQHPQGHFSPICLESGMQKLNPSPFFVAGNWLVTIRNRNEICWLRLPEDAG